MISLASLKPSWKNWRQLPTHLAICLGSTGRYAHSELVFGERNTKTLCFSATRSLGVRYEERDITGSEWDVQALTMTEQQEAYMRTLINETIGEKYDMRAIIHAVFPLIKDDIDTKDCSGVSAIFLARDGYLPLPLDETAEHKYWSMTPSQLAKAVRDKESLCHPKPDRVW